MNYEDFEKEYTTTYKQLYEDLTTEQMKAVVEAMRAELRRIVMEEMEEAELKGTCEITSR